jgi:5-methylcytosine-specific restriction protein A
MATINRPKKKDNRTNKTKTEIVIKTHKLVYDTPYWKQLRLSYLMEHPVCECCNNALATEVHHITELKKATSDEEMVSLGFSINNLMAVCSTCHSNIHHHK